MNFIPSLNRVEIPDHLLPSTPNPTVLSVIHSEIPTILNVLVDQVMRHVHFTNLFIYSCQ